VNEFSWLVRNQRSLEKECDDSLVGWSEEEGVLRERESDGLYTKNGVYGD